MNLTTIKQHVTDILKENYATMPPVDVVAIAKNYGLSVRSIDLSGHAITTAAAVIDPEKQVLYIDATDDDAHKAFIIARAIARWHDAKDTLLHDKDRCILRRMPLGTAAQDREAELCFAALLLIPDDMLAQYASAPPEALTKIFGVSSDVIHYRQNL